MKYIVVAGGVVSGLGKGVTISSMGKLLQSCGLTVTAIKIDPYLNVDAGTMSPFEHGEVFVLNDGGESDLDLGNYERFLNITLTSDHNITTGKIYRNVILKERKGDYLGKTVQVVPHITNEIQDWIERVAHIPTNKDGKVADVCLIEVGGTVGDIESSVFFEALRQFEFRMSQKDHTHKFLLCFVSLVPILSEEEQKTKPTQHGVRDLRSLGLSPTIIFCRCKSELELSTKNKISSFCHVQPNHVLSVHDVNNVYHVPLLLKEQNLHKILLNKLDINNIPSENIQNPNLNEWTKMAYSLETFDKTVKIALIGKYTGLQDSYLSVIKSLKHASIACGRKLDIIWVEATQLEKFTDEGINKEDTDEYKDAWDKVKNSDGVVVPGGFGTRGFLGKVLTAEYCRINKKPYLGICLGFQAMVVEYTRNVLNKVDSNSTEFNEDTSYAAVIFMPEIDKDNMGGTMRLGIRGTKFTHTHGNDEKSTIQKLYNNSNKNAYENTGSNVNKIPSTINESNDDTIIMERHRHRYEVNPEKVEEIHNAGLHFVGRDLETGTRMEIAELSPIEHPYYVGCQYHPEFLSRPLLPSPPFLGLISSSINELNKYI